MLVLSRKPDEAIIINGNINVKILAITGTQVKLGITADPGISVHREEVQKKILNGKKAYNDTND